MEAKKRGRVENLRPWRPGQSGNPAGRPKKLALDHALTALLESEGKDGKSRAEELAEALLKHAKKGNARIAQLIAERTQGRPRQTIEVSGPEGRALEIQNMTDEQLDQRIKELLAKWGKK